MPIGLKAPWGGDGGSSNPDPERAELIRVQIALARKTSLKSRRPLDEKNLKDRGELAAMKFRAIELEDLHVDKWFPAPPGLTLLLHRSDGRTLRLENPYSPRRFAWDRGINWDRGFIMDAYLANAPIEKLPENLCILGNLDLSHIRQLNRLPQNLRVGGRLNLRGTGMDAFPADEQERARSGYLHSSLAALSAREILVMPGLSDEAKITGLRTASYEALAEQVERQAARVRAEGRT